MSVYIYAADQYCEACGEDIKQRLLAARGESAEKYEDETTYDSDDFPKGPYPPGEADTPGHCGSGEDCLAPLELTGEDGQPFKVGAFLDCELTTHGVCYLQEQLANNPGPVTEFWASVYSDYL